MRKAVWIIVAFVFVSFSATAGYSQQILPPVTGHRVQVDNNVGDWVGIAPVKENSAAVDKGEFIYRDAKKDDVGPGNYTYGKNEKITKGADIREFRVTFDDKRIYFLLKMDRPNDWWAPYRIIGIDEDGALGKAEGTTILAQGDVDELDTYNGTYAELKVAPNLACEYVIGVSQTYRGRIWDAGGQLIAKCDGNENDTPGFKVADANWYAVEIAIPYTLIGDPRGKTWRFVVAGGLQDKDILREIYATADDWHGGGSRDKSTAEDGPDPDVYDLIGAGLEDQKKDLNGYQPAEGTPDPKNFTTISKSFVTVTFGGAQQ
jgi:hypothetical protein